jgi:hypothetical protein
MPQAMPTDRWQGDSHSDPAAAADRDCRTGLDTPLDGIAACLS